MAKWIWISKWRQRLNGCVQMVSETLASRLEESFCAMKIGTGLVQLLHSNSQPGCSIVTMHSVPRVLQLCVKLVWTWWRHFRLLFLTKEFDSLLIRWAFCALKSAFLLNFYSLLRRLWLTNKGLSNNPKIYKAYIALSYTLIEKTIRSDWIQEEEFMAGFMFHQSTRVFMRKCRFLWYSLTCKYQEYCSSESLASKIHLDWMSYAVFLVRYSMESSQLHCRLYQIGVNQSFKWIEFGKLNQKVLSKLSFLWSTRCAIETTLFLSNSNTHLLRCQWNVLVCE